MILPEKLIYNLMPIFWKRVKTKSSLPGTKVLFTFKRRYPKARQVHWEQIDVFKWQVTFKLKEIINWGLYTSEGIWLETKYAVRFRDIPEKVQENLGLKYGLNGLQRIYKIQMSPRTIFEVHWGNGIYNLNLLYDENGKLVGKIMG